jgi:two-component system OmpR family response regulator
VDTKILIITDDRDTKSVLVQGLNRTRARTLAIPTEPGALRSYLDQADLLILDVPQADTQEFRLLRQIRQLSTVPVILLVPSDDYRVGIRGLDRGADHVMPKPVNEKELRARIRALLRRVRTAQREAGDPWAIQPALDRGSAPAEAPASNAFPA